jgi:hypothetical protein
MSPLKVRHSLTDFINLNIKSTQSFRCVYSGMVCMYVCIYRIECSFMYKYMCLYCMTTKKKYFVFFCDMLVIKWYHLYLDRAQNHLTPLGSHQFFSALMRGKEKEIKKRALIATHKSLNYIEDPLKII